MEGLLVDRVDRHLRGAEKARIIERPNFQNHCRKTRPPRHKMRAAFGAELACHGALEIRARKVFGPPPTLNPQSPLVLQS
jgi:hypothetical protein